MKHDRGRDARQVCTDLELELKARVATMERHIRVRWDGRRRRRHGLDASCVVLLVGVGVHRKRAAGTLGPRARIEALRSGTVLVLGRGKIRVFPAIAKGFGTIPHGDV
jgi:hypothetical protein